MKENINELANILAVSILADGEFDQEENQLLDAIEPLVTAKGRLNEVH
jgi:tellurite resistance protein